MGDDLMSISYNRMWKLLIDKNMRMVDLRRSTSVAPNTMTKLRRNQRVDMSVLERICDVLDCSFGDIVEYIKDE